MTLFNKKYRIETTRLEAWDYSWPWWYYVTICTKESKEYFGRVSDEAIELSELGEIALSCWSAIPDHIPYAELDVVQVMPNHIHGIVIINGNSRRDVACNVSTTVQGKVSAKDEPTERPLISPKRGSLGVVLRSYKSAVTREAHRSGHTLFAWQPRFYDHIIRNEHDLLRIRTYIAQNALAWDLEKSEENSEKRDRDDSPSRLYEVRERNV